MTCEAIEPGTDSMREEGIFIFVEILEILKGIKNVALKFSNFVKESRNLCNFRMCRNDGRPLLIHPEVFSTFPLRFSSTAYNDRTLPNLPVRVRAAEIEIHQAVIGLNAKWKCFCQIPWCEPLHAVLVSKITQLSRNSAAWYSFENEIKSISFRECRDHRRCDSFIRIKQRVMYFFHLIVKYFS